jgi:hypothetical protein
VGTRKISQLDTISDANISGEAILPVVVSDPLIPNRKAKVNQLFRGVAQGTKTTPGLAFDLDRNTGLYQNAYDQIGMTFGEGALYMTRIQDNSDRSSLYITAVDDVTSNANIVLAPKGTGTVRVTGQFTVDDGSFILEDAQGPKARFEIGNVGTGSAVRIFTMPQILTGSGTTIVGDDTSQTLRNKTIFVDENSFVLVSGQEEAEFQINWDTTSGTRRSYFLPDSGPVTTTLEPTATSSTLLDTKTEQTVLSKKFVDVQLTRNSEVETPFATINTDALTTNRIVTFPDLDLTILGTESTQTILNKTYVDVIFSDSADLTKKVTLDVSNMNTSSTTPFGFPTNAVLNNTTVTNLLVTEISTQTLTNKTLLSPQIKVNAGDVSSVTFDTSNVTGNRTIRFPDSDATLLSTANTSLEDVQFGAGIGAATLVGRTRLQQFFYAGF